MTTKARTLIEESIPHWERMSTGTGFPREGPFWHQCPLCKEYIGEAPNFCAGCPVREKTGQIFCMGTPYEQAYTAFLEEKEGPQSDRFKVHALRELNFLKELLT